MITFLGFVMLLCVSLVTILLALVTILLAKTVWEEFFE